MFRSKIRDECALLKRCMSTIQHRVPRAGLVQNVDGYAHFTGLDGGVQASQRAHPLAATMDDQQLRETRRLLLLSLQAITYTLPNHFAAARVPSAVSSLSNADTDDNESSTLIPMARQSLVDAEVQNEESNKTLEPIPKNQAEIGKETTRERKRSIKEKFRDAIQQKNVQLAISLFNEAPAVGKTKLPRKWLLNLAFLAIEDDPAMTLSIMKQAEQEEHGLSKKELGLYERLCRFVGTVNFDRHNRRYVTTFVENLLGQIKFMERDTQQRLLPLLITSLLTQPYHVVGIYAGEVYQYMANHDLSLQPYFLKKWLMLSKYNRQDDLPFHDVMHRLAMSESPAHPLIILQAISNMFPFTDTQKMCVALRALQVFQGRSNLEKYTNLTRREELQIDLDCLECISAATARSGNVELIIIIWEVLQQCNYRPTETIYENTILSFASKGADLVAAFGAINAMKGEGYEISRSLYRSFSRAMRFGVNAEKGIEILESSTELVSLETLNAMMSFCAYRGDVANVFYILQSMRSRNINPDIHSYSFAMEVLGKHILTWDKSPTPYELQENLDLARNILDDMEKDGILLSRDLLRNYIELLCVAGESAMANLVVDDVIRDSPDLVCSKTLYTLIKANVDNGDFERAKMLAGQIRDDIPTIWNMIRREQQRYNRSRQT